MSQTLLFSHFGFLITSGMPGYFKQRDSQLSSFCLFLEVSFWSWGKKRRMFSYILLVSWIFLCSASEAIIVPPPQTIWLWLGGPRTKEQGFLTILILWPFFQTSGVCLEWSYWFLTAIFLPEHLLIIQLYIVRQTQEKDTFQCLRNKKTLKMKSLEVIKRVSSFLKVKTCNKKLV